MKSARIFAVLALFCLPGCSTPGSEYAKAHLELPAAHREILRSGIVPGGIAVEGMTKEQVRLAVGNPSTVEKFNQGDVWVYTHEAFTENAAEKGDSGADGRGSKKSAFTSGRQTMVEKKMIFFQGDRATHTQNSTERE